MGLYKKLRKYVSGKRLEWPVPFKENIALEDIYVRDPYIITDGQGGYALVGTIYHLNYNDSYGTVMYKSKDLRNWSGPYMLVEKAKLDIEYSDFWAPEIHKIGDKYLLAVTLHPAGGKRGTYLFTSEKYDGEYTMATRMTPVDKSSLDGTLYSENGRLWCVYCYEYIDCNDGQIRAVRLKEDLSGIEEDTDRLLFKASDNKYKPYKGRHKVTDGPYMFVSGGALRMLWSTHTSEGKYVQLLAHSDNMRLDGNWSQDAPLYESDGGHGMVFTDYDGKRYLILHTPNARTIFSGEYEHPIIIPCEV